MRRPTLTTFCVASLLAWCGTVRVQAPVAGQPYQVPGAYAAYAAGTAITYGGYRYVIQGDGTMLLASQAADPSPPADAQGAGQAYQVPDGYAGTAAGSVINNGGASYAIGLNGTMVLVTTTIYNSNYKQSGGLSPGTGTHVYPNGGHPTGTYPGTHVYPNGGRVAGPQQGMGFAQNAGHPSGGGVRQGMNVPRGGYWRPTTGRRGR